MANVFVNLPTTAADGAGAAVDVSAMGGVKTVTVAGNGSVFEPVITIEVALDAAGTEWSPLDTFQQPGERTFTVVARWMRAVTSNYRGGGAATVNVGSDDAGSSFSNLAAPAGNGSAAATDTSTLGVLRTVQVEGDFRGAVNIDISNDGGVTFQTAFSFASGHKGVQTQIFAAEYMRVTRTGVPSISPGLPVVNIGAVDPTGGDFVPPYVDLRDAPYNVVADDSSTAVAQQNTTGINLAIATFSGTNACLMLPDGEIYLEQAGVLNWSIKFGTGVEKLTLRGQGMYATTLVQNGVGDLGEWDAIVIDGASEIELCDFGVMQGTIDNPDPGQQNHLICLYNNTAGGVTRDINGHDLFFGKCLGDALRFLADAPPEVVADCRFSNLVMHLNGVVNIPSGRVGARSGLAIQRGLSNIEISDFYIRGAQNSALDMEPTGANTLERLYLHDGFCDNSLGNSGTCGSIGGASGGTTVAVDCTVRDVTFTHGKIIVVSSENLVMERVTVYTDIAMPADPTESLISVRQSNVNILLSDCRAYRLGTSGDGNCLDIENTGLGTRVIGGYYQTEVSGEPIIMDGSSDVTIIGPELHYDGPVPNARYGIEINAVLGNADDIFIDDVKIYTNQAPRLQAGVLLQVRAPRSMARVHVSNVKLFGNGAFYGVVYSIGAGTTFDATPLFQGIENAGALPQVWRAEDAGGTEIDDIFPITSGNRGLLSARRLEGIVSPEGIVTGNLGDVYTWRPTTTTSQLFIKASETVAGTPDNTGWELVAPRLAAAITADVAIVNAEAVVVSLLIPANTLANGDTFIFGGWAIQAGTNAAQPTARIRVGPVTLTGNIPTTLLGISGANALPVQWQGSITFRSIGAGGTVQGQIQNNKSDGAGYDFVSRSVANATVAVDTTVDNLIEFTLDSGNAAVTYTFEDAYISQVV